MFGLVVVLAITLAAWAAIALIVPPVMVRAGFAHDTWRIIPLALGPLGVVMALMCWGEHHRPQIEVRRQAAAHHDPGRRHVVVFVSPDDPGSLASSLDDLDAGDALTVAMLTPFDAPDPDMNAYRSAVDGQLAAAGLDATVVVAFGRQAAAQTAVQDWEKAATDAPVSWTGPRRLDVAVDEQVAAA